MGFYFELRGSSERLCPGQDPASSAVVSDYGQDAVVYLLQVWSRSGDYWATTCQTKENIQKVFNEKSIRHSYQNVNVTVKKGE